MASLVPSIAIAVARLRNDPSAFAPTVIADLEREIFSRNPAGLVRVVGLAADSSKISRTSQLTFEIVQKELAGNLPETSDWQLWKQYEAAIAPPPAPVAAANDPLEGIKAPPEILARIRKLVDGNDQRFLRPTLRFIATHIYSDKVPAEHQDAVAASCLLSHQQFVAFCDDDWRAIWRGRDRCLNLRHTEGSTGNIFASDYELKKLIG